MIKNIKVNLEILEQMLYFWQACTEKEKVNENYLRKIAAEDDMKLIYDSELDEEGVRKVLSAITNRERLSDASQRQWKFWNNNMWVLEEQLILDNMVRPIKKLNADSLIEKVNAKKDIAKENIEIVFIPATDEEYIIKDNKLIINFFKIMADLFDEEKVTINNKPVLEYIEEKILEM